MPARTPGSWTAKPDRMLRATVIVAGERAKPVAVTVGDGSREEHIANAAFIVQACNAHDELVEALLLIVDISPRKIVEMGAVFTEPFPLNLDERGEIARAALAKVGA